MKKNLLRAYLYEGVRYEDDTLLSTWRLVEIRHRYVSNATAGPVVKHGNRDEWEGIDLVRWEITKNYGKTEYDNGSVE